MFIVVKRRIVLKIFQKNTLKDVLGIRSISQAKKTDARTMSAYRSTACSQASSLRIQLPPPL